MGVMTLGDVLSEGKGKHSLPTVPTGFGFALALESLEEQQEGKVCR